jgi:hypothetical protein
MAMLKKRIRKWDLDKKHKEPDMLAARRIALEREALGKKTAFIIRNREVTHAEIKHYFKRKGVRSLRESLTGTGVGTSTSTISCYTPPPSPRAGDVKAPSAWQNSEEVDLDVGKPHERKEVLRPVVHEVSRQKIPSPAERIYATLPTTTTEWERFELLLASTRDCCADFIKCLLPGRFWNPPVMGLEFFVYMLTGYNRLQVGDFFGGFSYFNRAFKLIRAISQIRDLPFLLLCTYQLIELFDNEGNQEILSQLCNYALQLSEIDLGHTHPFQEIMAVLRKMPCRDRS